MLRLPFQAQVEITDVCNLRCKHCYHFDTDNMPASNDLSDDAVLQVIRKMIDNRIYSLVITGGEPLARPKTLIRAAELAKTAGMYVSVNTNLLLLTPQIISALKESDIDSFLVSCPASEPDIYREITRLGDYDKFTQKLRMLLDANFSCLVNMVVTQTNFPLIRSTARDLKKMGVKRFSVTPACLNVEHPDLDGLLSKKQTIVLLEDLRWCADVLGLEVDTLVALPKCFFPVWWWERSSPLLKYRTCQAGRMTVNISNIGDVRPCPHNPIVYGNLFKESMESIWDKMAVYRNNGTVPGICKSCAAVESCRGACRTNAMAVTGRLDEPDRLTIGPVNFFEKKRRNVIFNENSIVNFRGKLRWRNEFDGYYSVTSKRGGGNLMVVNEEMFRFICWMEKSLPLTIKELTKNIAGDSAIKSFIRIFEAVIRKEFVSIS
ncbi:MAG: radical SAM protein [Patescibacteria group bacterium]|nr:radical SAM protein [Patescibacteria group bacterium]